VPEADETENSTKTGAKRMAGNMNASAVAQSWVQGMQQATAKITAGVQATTQSPTAAAAAAVNFWQQQVSSPKAANNFVKGLNKVSLQDWQQAMLNKGVNRVGSGAAAAQSKFQTFMSAFLPFIQNVAAQVRAMPKTTLEDRIARMVAQVRGAAQFQGV
jgi:hypothetical protein